MPYVNRVGVRLYYEDAGAGPVILLHTGGGGDRRMWELAGYTVTLTGYRILLLDHRGHGRSDCPAGLSAHRISEYVADVIAVLDHAGVDRAALVGYSAGGDVAYAVASRHPDRVGAMVGIGAVGPPEGEDREVAAAEIAAIRAHGMRAAMERIAAEESQRPPDWLIDNLAETDAEMFALLVETWAGQAGSWAEFAAIQSPALIICGENEEPDAARHAALAAQTMPARLGRDPAWAIPPAGLLAHRPVVPTAHSIPGRGLDAARAGVRRQAPTETRSLAWRRRREALRLTAFAPGQLLPTWIRPKARALSQLLDR